MSRQSKATFNYPHIVGLLIGTCLILFLLLLTSFARPISDDISLGYFANPLIHNPLAYTSYFYNETTGRYGQGFAVSMLFSLFGEGSTIIAPLLEIVLFIASMTWIVFSIQKIFKRKTNILSTSIIISLLLAALFVMSSPSIFDSFLWLTSSTVYELSVISLLLTIGLSLQLYRNKHLYWWHLLILLIITVLSQSFSEPTSALTIILAAISAFIAIVLLKNRKMRNLSIVVLLGAVIGFLIVYISPGSKHRQTNAGSGFNLHEMFISSLHNFSLIFHMFFSWQGILISLVALCITMIIGVKLSKKARNLLLTSGLFLIVVPSYLTFIIAAYSMGLYMPVRTYTMPSAFAALGGVIILVVIFNYLLTSTLERHSRKIWGVLAALLCVTFVITAFQPLSNILKAEVLRSSLYSSRESSVKAQLSNNEKVITITPAPILLEKSDASDFSYVGNQIDWITDGFVAYYHLEGRQLKISPNQPEGYCLDTQAPYWYGAHNCSTIQK